MQFAVIDVEYRNIIFAARSAFELSPHLRGRDIGNLIQTYSSIYIVSVAYIPFHDGFH